MGRLYDSRGYPDENNIFQHPTRTVAYEDDDARVVLLAGHFNGWHYGFDINSKRGIFGLPCEYKSGCGLSSLSEANGEAANLALDALRAIAYEGAAEEKQPSAWITKAIEACRNFELTL